MFSSSFGSYQSVVYLIYIYNKNLPSVIAGLKKYINFHHVNTKVGGLRVVVNICKGTS